MDKRNIFLVVLLAGLIINSSGFAQNNKLKGIELLDIPKGQLLQVIAFMDALDNFDRNRMLAADKNNGHLEEKIKNSKTVKLSQIKMISAPARCKDIKEITVKLLEKEVELIELSRKQEKGLKGKTVPFLNSDVYNDVINLTEEYKSERNEILLEIYNDNKKNYTQSLFLGNWYSTSSQKMVSILSAGTWKMVSRTGDWYLEDGDFIWTYSDLGPKVKERNPILHVEKRKFVLLEEHGCVTVFYKTN